MSIAQQTAKAWNDAAEETDTLQVPEVPKDVTARLTAIWTDAYHAAHTAFVPERDRLAAALKAARADVTSLNEDMVTVENNRDQLADAVTKLKTIVDATEERIETLTQTARDAELRLEAAERERDRLAAQVDALIARIPARSKRRRKSRPRGPKGPRRTQSRRPAHSGNKRADPLHHTSETGPASAERHRGGGRGGGRSTRRPTVQRSFFLLGRRHHCCR